MATELIARRDGAWLIVSLAPDVCLTPLGSIPVPVPYQVVASLQTAELATTNVNVNGNPVVVFDTTFVPTTQGDEAGTLGGVKTGTTASKTRPLLHSTTVNFQGKAIVRANDVFWMNGP
ncbi:DUF4150 domain-containing protein [Caballeronia ptereochthonis]|jgi:hypothetical protein|uniref:PF13665 domain protein n=1 Tax=Caballeronia ptereochthonis TaxID=1777144 RepID=A0A158DQD8_9BURK|nr:DUF4150 domain-containing protein [Caballeronia ptereochthonis]SAK96396.1 PF13665 domain protein [Caballeronia ptereochthonis]